MPTSVSTLASLTSKANTCCGLAPIARKIDISLRRSCKLVSKLLSMPSNPATTTKTETAISACSATDIIPHSSCSATPGMIALSGSCG
ncbi:Uncharacterised protein [Vibrio cholerae]|nr:Uncharacterised protein [Vibrio cholerae]